MTHKITSLRSVRLFFLICLTILAQSLCAQNMPTAVGGMDKKMSGINVHVASGYRSGGDYEFTGHSKLLHSGTASDAYVTNVRLSVPVMKIHSGTLSLSGHYNYMHQEFKPQMPAASAGYVHFDDKHHTWGAAAMYNFRSTLWGKMLMGHAVINAECSRYGFERISGFAAATMLIKRTEYSSFSAGAVLLLNSASRWPLFPFVTYWRKFNDKWQLSLVMPQCHVQYNISQKDKLMLGTTIGGEHYYIRPKHAELPSTCMYSRSYVRPELVYEHSFTPLMRCSVRCGSIFYINGRLNSDSGNRKYVEIEHDASAFVQVAFSYGLKLF